MSISVSSITKLYDEQKALNDVTLEVRPGEILGFLGPNGAGKSTLMKIITGFIPPTSGSVKVCGLNMNEEGLKIKSLIGYLPELNPLYPDMYVKEYLMFTAGVYGIKDRKKRVQEMIEKVGLQVEQNKKIGALSKGYKQRVGLAQAMIHEPDVLILDEPTTGLDPNQIGDIRELIKSLGKEKTVMLSTHIMQEVEAICDRVVIINKGKIVANEAVENLKQITKNRITLIIEFDREVSKNAILKINGVDQVSNVEGNKWSIQGKHDVDVRNDINLFTNKHGISILSMTQEANSLERVFKQLTTNVDVNE